MPLVFDFGFGELLVIGIVALIVVGPKELPQLFRTAGQYMGKARGMAREFSRAMNDAADEAGVKDIQKTFRAATNPVGSAMDGVRDAAKSMTDFTGKSDTDSSSGKPKGPETQKLSAEREAAKRKIEANAARAAADRKKREADEAATKAAELEKALAEEAATQPANDKGDPA